jgi:uncharacterized membrane protein YjgN (DUF898 family)
MGETDAGLADGPPLSEPSAPRAGVEGKRRKAVGRFKFSGDGATLFKILAVNLALTLLTLGFYRFWARAKLRRYLYGQLSLKGHRFGYHGTGKEGLQGFFRLAGLALVGAAALGVLTVGVRFGLQDGGGLTGKEAALAGGILMNLVVFGVSLLFYPYAQIASRRYQLSRTSLNGVRFSFHGTYGEALRLHVGGALLSLLTFGLYTPWYLAGQQRWLTSGTRYGNRSFSCDLTGRQLLKPFLTGLLLLPFTFGLSAFWLAAAVQRETAASTRFGKARFQNAVTGGALLRWTFLGLAARGLTLGLALPWVKVRSLAYFAGCLTVQGPLGLDTIRQEAVDANSLGDALVDDMGLDGIAM